MKKILLLLPLLCAAVAPAAPAQKPAGNVLANIQARLLNAPLDSLLTISDAIDRTRKLTPNFYLTYWEAYIQHKLDFAYGPDRKAAEKAVEKGLALLEDVKNQTSEYYALLSVLQGEQLEFTNPVAVPFKAPAVEKSARRAIELDPNNPRGYYALGLYDYYTPKLYGGGKILEENFKKAVALPAKPDPNPYAPAWGQASSYFCLSKFYKNEDKLDLAAKYVEMGLQKFPTDKGLQTLSKSLKK